MVPVQLEIALLADAIGSLVVLADGMGGYKSGEVASALAVTTVLHDVTAVMKHNRTLKDKQVPPPDAKHPGHEAILIKNSINHANSTIYKMAKADEQCQGMGTTVVAGLFHNDMVTIGHVGDSRMYRLRGGKLQQITKDHSLIQELIDRKLYTPEEAYAKMPKNLVTRGLGLDFAVEVDIIEENTLPEDIYLVCSDGLTDMVNDEEIHLTLGKYSANLVQIASTLIQQANSKGGKDNITVVLVRVKNKVSNQAITSSFNTLLNRFFKPRG